MKNVVAGIRTPQPIAEMEQAFPEVYAKFESVAEILEKHYKDMQDMEFTVEDNKLFMLQTRMVRELLLQLLRLQWTWLKKG